MSIVENTHYQGLSTLNQAIISAFRSDPEARLSFFETLLHHLPFSVVVFDYNHRYIYCNPAAIRNEEIRHWIIGKDDFEYCQHRGYDLQLAQIRRKHFVEALETQQPVEWEETFTSRENTLIHQLRHIHPIFHQGQFQIAIGYGQDITKRKSMEIELEKLNQERDQRIKDHTNDLEKMNLQLKHQALHDTLTQLPNRLFLQQKLDQALTRIQKTPGQAFALLFLDADRFKVINDSLGHNLGDHFLVDLSKRLHGCVRERDIVARLGGDEFVILVEDTHLQISSTATRIAKRIHQKLQQPFQLAEHCIVMSVSIGIVLSNLEYTSHEALLRNADIAMYQAKSQGRGRYQIFQQGNEDNSQLSLEQDFYQALQMQALDIHYQPIIHLESRQLVGFEALARWFHPQKGFISPEVFIPLAEESQTIKQLDLFVLQAAIQNVQQWQADFGISLHLNVNFSAQHFYEAAFAETLYAVLESFHFPPEQLKVEITESILLTPSTQVKENIEKLKEMNIDLHIDDFGIGYSSLQYLQHFDVEVLKIDRSFITHLTTSEKHNKLVRSIITMSQIMGFKIIAEGIETQEQCELLASLGCTFGQGYLFSRPLAVKDIAAYIATSQSCLTVVN